MREIRLHTLGDFGDALSITAYCESCRRSRDLDLPQLRPRYGPELTVAALLRDKSGKVVPRRTEPYRNLWVRDHRRRCTREQVSL